MLDELGIIVDQGEVGIGGHLHNARKRLQCRVITGDPERLHASLREHLRGLEDFAGSGDRYFFKRDTALAKQLTRHADNFPRIRF